MGEKASEFQGRAKAAKQAAIAALRELFRLKGAAAPEEATMLEIATFASRPKPRKVLTSVMNFYVFDDEGKIIDDIAATGMLGILQGIGAAKRP